uniref:rRNA methyltransferase n=1 Tax=Virgibacillus oceani TaxID=1479511 RepID=A0A917H3H6_9BACI|nr:rRNA methyltransferase [Virgibacillus oceani]
MDATAGNGNDTIFLSQLTGETGQVLAFDVQEKAITAVTKRLTEKQLSNTRLIHDGHENIVAYLEEGEQIGGAIFNLGYLPGGDKSIITKADTTIKAVKAMLPYLKCGGTIVLVVYHGHNGGQLEKDALMEYTSTLSQQSFHVLQYGFINQKNHPPFILAVEKRNN